MGQVRICVKVNSLFSDYMERIPTEIDLCMFTSINVDKQNKYNFLCEDLQYAQPSFFVSPAR